MQVAEEKTERNTTTLRDVVQGPCNIHLLSKRQCKMRKSKGQGTHNQQCESVSGGMSSIGHRLQKNHVHPAQQCVAPHEPHKQKATFREPKQK